MMKKTKNRQKTFFFSRDLKSLLLYRTQIALLQQKRSRLKSTKRHLIRARGGLGFFWITDTIEYKWYII